MSSLTTIGGYLVEGGLGAEVPIVPQIVLFLFFFNNLDIRCQCIT